MSNVNPPPAPPSGSGQKVPISIQEEMRTSYLDHAMWDADKGTLAALFTAPTTYLDKTLADFYNKPATTPGNAGYPTVSYHAPLDAMTGKPNVTQFVPAALDGKSRGGLLTLGGILAVQAAANQTSPVKRGLFVREKLMCQDLPPPPPNIMVELPALNPNMTTRERFAQHDRDPACAGCHLMMDPIGVAFENFDTTGRWRQSENGKPIDNSGQINGMDNGAFKGPIELGQKLASSDAARSCLSLEWFRYAYGRDQDAADACSVDVVKRRFASGGYKLKDLLAALAETDAFLYRRVSPGGMP